MSTNGKPPNATKLEAELAWLNMLLRERRKQLGRLEKCPNKDCPCRFIWREHVEKRLTGQISKIRQRVSAKGAPGRPAKKRTSVRHPR
jgi:hypothetical protein